MERAVLVIEDNPANLELMAYLLRRFGYAADQRRDGGEGLDAAHREVPDLILCDIQLPEIDGTRWPASSRADPVLREGPAGRGHGAGHGRRPRQDPGGGIRRLHRQADRPGNVHAASRGLPPARPADDPPGDHPGRRSRRTRRRPRLAQGTILIVDDLPPNIAVFSSIVQSFGYSVIAAENIKDGMELAKRYHPDMIVSDIHLRTESGYDFLRAVKTVPQLCSVPFVFISSTVLRERDQAVSLALGADRFISRPLEAAGAAGRDRIRLGRARDE